MAAAHDMPLVGIFLAFLALIIAGVLGRMLLDRTGSLPWMRSESSNLVAVRGMSRPPDVWLAAHTDSKSQTIGMLVRVGSVAVAGILLTLLVIAMLMQLMGASETTGRSEDWLRIQTSILSLLTALAIAPLALCFITNNSPGALDNATGVAAVLLAVGHVRPESSVGVVLTSAEEIGLAGARAFAASRRENGIAINCDTIDNSGRFICMTNDRARRDAVAMAKAGSNVGHPVKLRGTIPGILTDSIAFGRAGWSSCTLSRGNLGTLARVHTSRDEPGRIDGAGVALAARILAATVEELS